MVFKHRNLFITRKSKHKQIQILTLTQHGLAHISNEFPDLSSPNLFFSYILFFHWHTLLLLFLLLIFTFQSSTSRLPSLRRVDLTKFKLPSLLSPFALTVPYNKAQDLVKLC